MIFRNPIRVSLACLFSFAALQMAQSFAYTLDAPKKTITMAPGASASANNTDFNNAISYLLKRTDKTSLWTVKLSPGNYYLAKQISASGLQNVSFVSDVSKPAKLIKDKTWNASTGGEYLMKFTFSKNISLTGMQFYGQTDFSKSLAPVWPDQGVDFGSCDTVTVKNNGFYNFGNSAIRVTTTERDPVRGVNSFNTTVTNNLFNNIYQTSTTPNDEIHGGTANYLFANNVFYNLRGSVKFASRTDGAKNVRVLNNKINGGDHYGIEINNYNDMEISGNTIQNIKEFAINIYTSARATQTFDWGKNFTLAENNISNVGKGLRFSTEPYPDGKIVNASNLTIKNNIFNSVKDTSSMPTIAQSNGKIAGLTITGNKLSNIANKKYIGYSSGSTQVTYYNNLVNGAPYGPQQTTASK